MAIIYSRIPGRIPIELLENYAKEIKREQEEAGQKDCRKLCYMRDVPQKDRQSTAGYVIGILLEIALNRTSRQPGIGAQWIVA